MRRCKPVVAVVTVALWLACACAGRVSAEIVEGESSTSAAAGQREGVEPLAAAALSAAATPTRDEPEPAKDVRPPPGVPGFPGLTDGVLRTELLPDGLELHDYAVGAGVPARPGDRVRIHYVGQLLDGTEFDSTYARATPFEIELGSGRLIPGMERGLEGVRVGMRRTLVIPPALAYGERALGVIPAHATLVFHVEVLGVEVGESRF